jgi:hypothetical protein
MATETHPAPTDQPLSYRAILVGIDDYSGKPLGGCVNDIDQIERILLDRLGVPPERITRFAAPRPGAPTPPRLASLLPTHDALLNALAGLADTAGDDAVFLYYSGHGSQAPVRPVAREALVPVDFDGTAKTLLWDFQLNPLIARIAERARDLTIVLDCCHSASAMREDLGPEAASRYLPLDGLAGLDSFRVGIPSRDLAGLAPAGGSHLIAAACQAGELAFEVPPDAGKPSQGSFSRALVTVLDTAQRPLGELRWADVWTRLLDRVTGFQSRQHPHLLGRSERRLFGGPWSRQDPGYTIHHEGDGFRIEAGTLTGLSPGAEVAVYGPEPDLFPKLGSADDHKARIGLLRIESAERAVATAVSTNGRLSLPATARGRLVKPGKPDRLAVSLDPFDAALCGFLEGSGLLVIRPDTSRPAASAARAEVFVRRGGDGRFHLGDAIYGDGRDPRRPPLVSVPASRTDSLAAVLAHYARYNQTLRLPHHPQNDKDLDGKLQAELLIAPARTAAGESAEDFERLQDPDYPQVARDSTGVYQIREGEGFAIRVSNQVADPASPPLQVSILNCAGSGRVEYLGDGEIAAGARQVFWYRDDLGIPFRPDVGVPGRMEMIDRIVVVATTRPDQDLHYLEVRESFAEVLGVHRSDRDMAAPTRTPPPPVEQWTAVQVPVRICR